MINLIILFIKEYKKVFKIIKKKNRKYQIINSNLDINKQILIIKKIDKLYE